MKNYKKDLEFHKNEADRYHRMLNMRFSDLYSSEDDLNRTRLAIKEDQRLYRKVGKKFVPVNDPYAYDGLRNGFWLIQVKDGSTSIRQEVYPDNACIHAAARLMEDKLVDIIRKAGEASPNKTPLSAEEKKDWDKFIKKHGKSFNTLHYPSMQENAEKIVKALIGEDKL